MAFSKSHLFSKEEQELCSFGRAIGHAARVRILRELAKKGRCKAMSILKNYPISKAAMSQHLRILRMANLVIFDEQFPHTYYSLNVKTASVAARLPKAFLKELK